MSNPYRPTLRHPQQQARHSKIYKVLSGTDPEKVTNERRMFTAATFYPKQGNSQTDNGSDILIGWDSAVQPLPLSPGGVLTIEADKDGMPNNLEQLWVSGASGDGLYIVFTEGATVS